MYLQVMTTIDSEEKARALADRVLAKRLAGCVQLVGPVTSMYWWQGVREQAEEWLLVCKSTENLYERLESCIQENHPYDCPEIIATPVVRGSAAYLEWLAGDLDADD